MFQKRTYYDEAARVPAILSWPGVFPRGERCDRVMSALDLNATMLEAMCAPDLPGSQGRSALRLLKNPATGNWEDLAFSEYIMLEGPAQRMVRMDKWKLIYHHEQPTQLFDMREDPNELHDRAGDPSCRTVIRDLTDRALQGWNPGKMVTRLRESHQQIGLIREWVSRIDPPSQFIWERQRESNE